MKNPAKTGQISSEKQQRKTKRSAHSTEERTSTGNGKEAGTRRGMKIARRARVTNIRAPVHIRARAPITRAAQIIRARLNILAAGER